MKTQDGKLVVVAGKSRCGKTALTARELKNSKRICAWDPEDQWAQLPGWKRVATRGELARLLSKPGNLRVAYVAEKNLIEEFDFWASVVYKAGREVAPLDVVAEELADVTSPGKAADSWGRLLRTGLKRGISIYAISQRWAEADKTALNNVNEFWFVSMAPMDVDYMAKRSGIAASELAALRKAETAATVTCPFVKLAFDSGKIERGKLVFKK